MTELLEVVVGRMTPRKDAPLTAVQRETLSRLERFEAPYLEARVTKEGMTSHAYQEAFTEFKKYAGLFATSKEPLAMMSTQIDEVWHSFILFTKQYASFCNDYLGEFMHHLPATADQPVDKTSKENFVRRYNEVYGELHPLWDRNAPCTSCCSQGCASCGSDGNGGD
jgi:hypothetical protein